MVGSSVCTQIGIKALPLTYQVSHGKKHCLLWLSFPLCSRGTWLGWKLNPHSSGSLVFCPITSRQPITQTAGDERLISIHGSVPREGALENPNG